MKQLKKKLEGVKYIQKEIDELEERLECLRKNKNLYSVKQWN